MAPLDDQGNRRRNVEISRVKDLGQSSDARFDGWWCFDASVQPWVVQCEVRSVQGTLELTKVSIFLDPVPANIFDEDFRDHTHYRLTADVLRAIPLGQILDGFRRYLLEQPELERLREALRQLQGKAQGTGSQAAAERGAAIARRSNRRRPRRVQRDEAHYREVALRRLALEADGSGKGVNQRLADEYHQSVEAIRDWLSRCRQLEYLAPASPGQRSAMPGRRLLEYLDQQDDEEMK